MFIFLFYYGIYYSLFKVYSKKGEVIADAKHHLLGELLLAYDDKICDISNVIMKYLPLIFIILLTKIKKI